MSVSEFIHVLQSFPQVSAQEAENVISLKREYPFSQVLHALSARLSKDNGLPDSSLELQLAAVYAADRTILKSLMDADSLDRSVEPLKSEIALLTKPLETGKVDYADELINDLEKLAQLRSNFELLFVDGTSTSFVVNSEEQSEPLEEVKTDATAKSDHPKSKKERIIELAKSVSSESSIANEPKGNRRKRKDSAEALIDHIVVSKEELAVESEKQKEQNEIIEHFIKAQPTISGTKEKQTTPEDLTSIKSGDFTDSIISETLAEILIKQGKKEKAIEVLKKLIWKFPQKKAYFASQIEELKK